MDGWVSTVGVSEHFLFLGVVFLVVGDGGGRGRMGTIRYDTIRVLSIGRRK